MAAAVLLVAVCPSRFARRRLGLILLTFRRHALSWPPGKMPISTSRPSWRCDRERACASRCRGAGAIEGRPVYCPPLACASVRHALGGVGGDADLASGSNLTFESPLGFRCGFATSESARGAAGKSLRFLSADIRRLKAVV